MAARVRTDRIWRTLERAANAIGIIAAAASLGLIGYYASLAVTLLSHRGS